MSRRLRMLRATTETRNQNAPKAEYPATVDRPLVAEADVAATVAPARTDCPPLIIMGHWAPTVRRRRTATTSWIAPERRAQSPNTRRAVPMVEKTATIIPAVAARPRPMLMLPTWFVEP